MYQIDIIKEKLNSLKFNFQPNVCFGHAIHHMKALDKFMLIRGKTSIFSFLSLGPSFSNSFKRTDEIYTIIC